MKKLLAGVAISFLLIGCTANNQNINLNTNQAAISKSNNSQTYSLAEIAEANNTSKCWTTINSKVYDITSYISKHPGGPQKIMQICGKDGAGLFQNQHGDQPKPEQILASFQIGVLQ